MGTAVGYIVAATILSAGSVVAAEAAAPEAPEEAPQLLTEEADPETVDPLQLGGLDEESQERKRRQAKERFRVATEEPAQITTGLTVGGAAERTKAAVSGVQI